MGKTNNFDFLRFVLASFVLITHSYPLTGNEECDVFCKLFNQQAQLSYIGVRCFFVISGYLIFQSILRSKSLKNYFWNRVLRIFPALIVVLILSALFCFFSYEGNTSYWENISTQTYVINNILIYKGQGYIDGVFTNNRYRPSINGSLWTIRYEFTGYIFLMPFFLIKQRRFISIVIISAIYVVLLIMNLYFPNRGGNLNLIADLFNLGNNLFINLFCYFFAGSLLALTKIEDLPYKGVVLLIISILFFIVLLLDLFSTFQFILLPLITILFGSSNYTYINQWGKKFGDLSYGIYIYSFPIQQMLEYFYKPSVLEMMFISTIITIIFSHLSWIYIEKNFLKLKKLF